MQPLKWPAQRCGRCAVAHATGRIIKHPSRGLGEFSALTPLRSRGRGLLCLCRIKTLSAPTRPIFYYRRGPPLLYVGSALSGLVILRSRRLIKSLVKRTRCRPNPPAAVDQAAPKPVTHAEAGGCNSDSATFTRSRHTHSPQFIVLEIVFRYAHTRLPPIRHPEKETTHKLLSISVAPPILPLSRTDTSRPRRRHDKPN
jgi:hypothetical protein